MNNQFVCGLLLTATCSTYAYATDESELFSLTLDDLMSLTVSSGSDRNEKLRDTPASIQVITRSQIHQRGYTQLSEVLADITGFDLSTSYGHDYTTAYQRGYRTPSSQRTLVMINGVVNNLLWSHEYPINRQLPMSGIERIEVLSGPSGAVYGPNAFLGAINIITQDGRQLEEDGDTIVAQVQAADFGTKGLDTSLVGRHGKFSYFVSGKLFETDGPELADMARWGFVDEAYLSNTDFWGPVLKREHGGLPYGQYRSMDDEHGLIADFNYAQWSFGVNHWLSKNGYGNKLTFDRGQANAGWGKKTSLYYLRHETNLLKGLQSKSFVRYRSDKRWGNWAEATPDWAPGKARYSYVSISKWNSENASWKLRQDFEYQMSDMLHLSVGLKYERKELTKAYDICGYWSSAFCSSDTNKADLGPYDLGKGVYYSLDDAIPELAGPLAQMPSANIIKTTDKGAYVRATYKINDWSLSSALRWDNNSIYGTFVKPRVAVNFDFDEYNTIKVIYASAFQEPAPLQLYGGWNGRRVNPDLKPEEVQDLTLVWMYQQGPWFFDLSAYMSRYDNVIKEEAQNAGKRGVTGAEFRAKYEFDNPWFDAPQISSYLNYSYTSTKSHIYYDHQLDDWVGQESGACKRQQEEALCEHYDVSLGDIAPHKLNFGANVPITTNISFNSRFNYVSSRDFYLRNPLREQDIKLGDYLVTNLTILWQLEYLSIHLKVNNVFDSQIYHPGLAQADSGNQFTNSQGELLRSKGFNNSILPQVGRNWALGFQAQF